MRLCVLPLLLSAACVTDATQLLVEIDTDYAVPDELGFVSVEIEGTESRAGFELTTGDELPISFGVVPEGRDASRMVSVLVRGFEREDSAMPLVEQRAVTGFSSHRALVLPMNLDRDCEGVKCDPEETCGDDRACKSAAIDPGTLSVAGEEP
jgi:hypothetical protein